MSLCYRYSLCVLKTILHNFSHNQDEAFSCTLLGVREFLKKTRFLHFGKLLIIANDPNKLHILLLKHDVQRGFKQPGGLCFTVLKLMRETYARMSGRCCKSCCEVNRIFSCIVHKSIFSACAPMTFMLFQYSLCSFSHAALFTEILTDRR